jgi:hypothetical protein
MPGGQGGFRGLCAQCAKASRCALLLSWQGPVQECDQFLRRRADSSRSPARLAEKTLPPESFPPKGLCLTCGNLDLCPFPRPEGGVWHCEHYVEKLA